MSSRMDQSSRIFLCRDKFRQERIIRPLILFFFFLSLPFACTSRDIVYFKAPGLIVISLPSLLHAFWM